MKIFIQHWVHFVILLGSISFSSLSLAGGFDVGNGGDGITRDGKLYLRDFAEAGVKPRSDVQKWGDPEMIRAVNGFFHPSDITWDRQLLIQKLVDINDLSPGLGYILIEVLKQYRITSADENLTLIPDASWNDALDPRLQIAVRLGDEIKISKVNWNRLDEINKIGLLIHEAVYSLSTPVCHSGTIGMCTPSKQQVRTLTAALLTTRPNHAADLEPLLELLNITPNRREFCSKPVIHGFMMAKYGENETTPNAFKEFEFGGMDSMFKIRKMINAECDRQFLNHPDSHDLVLTLGIRSMNVTKSEYFDEFGFQMSTSVVEKVNYVTKGEDAHTAGSCRSKIMVDFFSAISWFAAESPLGLNKICNSPSF